MEDKAEEAKGEEIIPKLSKGEKAWISDILEKFDFVKWDRLIGERDNNNFSIYGWIKNKKYHDFILLNFYPGKNKMEVSFISSSSVEYHNKIGEILGLIALKKCVRAERIFKIKNIIIKNE